MHIDILTNDIERFKTQPENVAFESFDKPGEYFSNQELEYKYDLSKRFQSYGERLLKGRYDDYLEDLVFLLFKQKLGSNQMENNLLTYRDKLALEGIFKESSRNRNEFAQLLRELLASADSDESLWLVFDRFSDWFTENRLTPGSTRLWPTFFLSFWKPEKFIFIKPDFFDGVLMRYGFEKLGRGTRLKSSQYVRVMEEMAELKQKVARHLGHTDYIGLQSFLWHVNRELNEERVRKLDNANSVWLIQADPEILLKQNQIDLSGALIGFEGLVSSYRKYGENFQKGDVLIFVDPDNQNTVLGEVILRNAKLQGSTLSFSASKLWRFRKTISTTLKKQQICPGFVANTQLREKESELFCREYLDLVRWNFLCAWNPAYFSSKIHGVNSTATIKEMKFNVGDRAKLRWESKHGTVGDPIYFLRTTEFSPGIVAKARMYNTKNVGKYVWIEFEDVRAGANDIFLTQSELESRLPTHRWSPGATLKGHQSDIKSSLNSLWRNVARKPMNAIYYGPPGTGKTFKLRNMCLEDYTGSTKTVSREEQMRKTLMDMNWREVIATTLLALKEKPTVTDIVEHEIVQIKARISNLRTPRQIRRRVWGELLVYTPEECENVRLEKRREPGWFWKDDDNTWRLVDDFDLHDTEIKNQLRELQSSSDDESSHFKRYAFVTFHQSYSYEEFVEGIRPILNRDGQGSTDLSYQLVNGTFKNICDRARLDKSGSRYAIFIDEINRGNISKIFGELITLIEEDKREGASNELSVTLPYSHEEFTVPLNLDIFGTMNSADRSLVHIDSALRRRFTFEEVMPDPNLLQPRSRKFKESEVDLQQLLIKMNERIEALFDREHTIGHSYFLDDHGETIQGFELPGIFKTKIIPLLTDYFFDDWSKVRRVLADEEKEDRLQFVRVKRKVENKEIYELNERALHDPHAYLGIYH